MTTSSLLSQIGPLIDGWRDEIVADTARILQFRTVSGGSPSEQEEFEREVPECFAWIGEKARAFGFDFRVIQGVVGEVAWRHANPDAPVLVIASHIDVVTPGGEWSHGPFSGDVADGFIWGRGAQDDKGPMIQSLYAMRAAKAAGIDPGVTVKLVIGTMEEIGDWKDMALYSEQAGRIDYAFTPDADFPIINGEKGMMSVLVEAEWPETGRDEETGMEFIRLLGGERDNMIPAGAELILHFPTGDKHNVTKEIVRATTQYVVDHDEANVTMVPGRERDVSPDRFETIISFIGKGGHASTPHRGHNAIVDAVEFYKDVETLPLEPRKFAALMHLFGSDLSGEAFGIARTHDFIGATTSCLVLIDMMKTGGRAIFNIRPTMGTTAEKDLAQIRETLKLYSEQTGLMLSAEPRGKMMNPIFMDPDDPKTKPFLDSLRAAYTEVTGRRAELRATGGTTYAKAIPNCVAFGPTIEDEEESLLHEPDERVKVESVLRNAKIYALSIAGLGK